MKAEFKKHILKFIQPGGTSRGILMEKPSWILKITNNIHSGFGEVNIIPGLSIDKLDEIETRLELVCKELQDGKTDFNELEDTFPAIHFAIEQAFADLAEGGTGILFRTRFSAGEQGIKMNGLVWMNPIDVMKEEGIKKIVSGFNCIKFKIGSFDFKEEYELLKYFRSQYGNELEIRVDANGAFEEKNVFQVMEKLAELKIHSIEQPIKPNQFSLMNKICRECEVPVALDEELIGVGRNEMKSLLEEIQPAYIILKPSLLGGFDKSSLWLMEAKRLDIDWWATSALESNVGLNAIAQWVSQYDLKLPQGLGTGGLYENNFKSGLEVRKEELWLNKSLKRENPF
jgi:o-succinylbenzoate synthase